MLVIRSAQMEVFDEEADRSFVTQALADLKSDLPPETIATADEPAMIDSGMQALSTAESQYGLDDDHSLSLFITMSWLYGAQFHLLPENKAILTDESINTRQRMSEIVKNNRA